jgi:hypothetical protein
MGAVDARALHGLAVAAGAGSGLQRVGVGVNLTNVCGNGGGPRHGRRLAKPNEAGALAHVGVKRMVGHEVHAVSKGLARPSIARSWGYPPRRTRFTRTAGPHRCGAPAYGEIGKSLRAALTMIVRPRNVKGGVDFACRARRLRWSFDQRGDDNMRPAPYIGISGIMSRDEIRQIFSAIGFNDQRPTAFGVLISAKTIRGIPNKYPNRYPSPERLRDVFARWNARDLLVLHYSADNDRTLSEDIGLAIQAIGRAPDGLQINMGNKHDGRSPNPNKVAAIASVYPHMRIILQVASNQFSSSAELWRHVREYAFSITDVLFDGSCGNGMDYFAKSWNVDGVRADLLELRSSFPHLGLGIAGGFSAYTLPQVADLLRDIPDLSIDAEGRLRDENDHLDVKAAIEYATMANRLVQG